MTDPEARSMWTYVAVDPFARPLARRIAPWGFVTPNRITTLSVLCGLGAATCFTLGELRLGGLLFIMRYFIDCVDGPVARIQGTGSARGAAFDISADVGGISLCAAALSWNLVEHDQLDVAVGLALLAAVIFYNWALAYRKHLGERAGRGDGGVQGQMSTRLPLLRSWVGLCRRRGMMPIPWAVEAEILALGIGPLVLPADKVVYGLVVALAFYLVADLVNLRRIFALTDILDSRRPSNQEVARDKHISD